MGPEKSTGEVVVRETVAAPPRGREKIAWYGPGLLWMVSSVGSGSVLFTPRVGSRYGFVLLWTALLVGFLTWVMIREIGRWTVVSGETILEGYRGVPGPRGWAVWLIFLPGLVSGITVVAGIAALVGSALMIAFPGTHAFYSIGVILVSAVLVMTGRYKNLELVTTVMAAVLIASAVTTAIVVFPGWGEPLRGLVPTIPADFDPFFILPWIGFLLAGAAGVMWFSYWVAARGYGGEVVSAGEVVNEETTSEDQPGKRASSLRSWLLIMGTTAAIGVIGGTIINVSFLTLGAELLRPQGIIPEGIRVAEDLSRLLTEVWGVWGFWLLILGVVIALWGSILANQDGWGRMFTDATFMLVPALQAKKSSARRLAANRLRTRLLYIVVVLTLAPIALFWAVRDPVQILSIAGIITATHMPVVVFLTLYINRTRLPAEFRPGPVWSLIMIGVGLFYGFYAGFFYYDLFRGG